MDRRSLAVCATFRNQAAYLLEWIAYHRVIGFDRFVLYDNGSTDGGADLIRNSPLADRVTVIHWPQRPGQLAAYRHFIDIFAPAYDWAAFIDVDEFVLPLDGTTLQDALQRCAQASAVLVNWRVFGPAGHEEPAPGLVIEAYDLRADDSLPVNRHVKSIVRCADLLDVTQTPHEFRLKGPACNALGQEVPNVSLQQSPCHQGLVINHYYTKSRREWVAKMHGAGSAGDALAPRYTEDVFDHLAAACQVKDETIKAFAPSVRSLLAGAVAGMPLPASVAPVAAPEPAGPVHANFAPVAAPVSVPPRDEPTGCIPERSTPALQPAAVPAQAAPGIARWRPSGSDAQERLDGLALVFRDRSRPSAGWLAALRGRAAGLIDPDFLLDDSGRLRDFASDEDARAACETILAEYQLG